MPEKDLDCFLLLMNETHYVLELYASASYITLQKHKKNKKIKQKTTTKEK